MVIYSSLLRKRAQYARAEQLLAKSLPAWRTNTGILMEQALVKFGINKDAEAQSLLTPLLADNGQQRQRYQYLSAALLDMQKLPLSDAYFEKAMNLGAGSMPYYNRACALAQIGEKDRAFAALNKAVDLGGYNVRHNYENDSDLQSLHGDSRWKVLMERMK